MEKRQERRYLTDKVAGERYRYFTRNLTETMLHCPQGRYRKWNGSCACAQCQWGRIEGVKLQRRKDLRRNVLAE